MTIIVFQKILIVGLGCTIFLLLFALLLKITNGLFWARFPSEFLADKNDPRFETERNIGKKIAHFLFNYVSPLFIALLILLVLTYIIR